MQKTANDGLTTLGQNSGLHSSSDSAATTIVVPDQLCDIARLIRADWKKVYFGAVPYLEALETLHTVTDNYGEDSGSSIVRYFLGNATSWRGPVAKAVKTRLNDLLKKD